MLRLLGMETSARSAKGPASPAAPNPPTVKLPAVVQTLWWAARPREFYRHCRARYGRFFVMQLYPFGKLAVPVDPEVVREVVRTDPEILRAGEGANVGNALEPPLGKNSLILLDGEPHRRHRKLMLPPFHGKRMHAYGDVIREETERSMAEWPIGEVFALRPRMQHITLRVIMRVVWGLQDPAIVERACEAIEDMLRYGSSPLVVFEPLRNTVGRLQAWPAFVRARAEVDAIVYAEIARRRQLSGDGDEPANDILSLLLAARFDDGTGLSDVELRDELVTLLFAGHETTATSLAWTLDLLLQNPAELKLLRADLDNRKDDRLTRVIWESLRVRPVVVDFIRKVKRPVELGGYRVEAGWHVSVSTYLTNCSPEVYDSPETFRPDRFVGGRPDVYAWVPFGGGNRRCLGAAFAEYEMQIVLKAVLERMDLKPASKHPEQPVLRNVTYCPKHGVRVRARVRA